VFDAGHIQVMREDLLPPMIVTLHAHSGCPRNGSTSRRPEKEKRDAAPQSRQMKPELSAGPFRGTRARPRRPCVLQHRRFGDRWERREVCPEIARVDPDRRTLLRGSPTATFTSRPTGSRCAGIHGGHDAESGRHRDPWDPKEALAGGGGRPPSTSSAPRARGRRTNVGVAAEPTS
jgi:hypothetical protein